MKDDLTRTVRLTPHQIAAQRTAERERTRVSNVRELFSEGPAAALYRGNDAARDDEPGAILPSEGVVAQAVVSRRPSPQTSVVPRPAMEGAPGTRQEPGKRLFRQVVINAHASGQEMSAVLRAESVGIWTLFWVASFAAIVLLGWTAVGSIEENALGRGVMRASDGVREVRARVSGQVVKLLAGVGTPVEEGQVLAEVDASELIARKMLAEQALVQVARRQKATEALTEARFAESIRLLERRRDLTEQRIRSQGSELARLRRRRKDVVALSEEGLVARLETDNLADGVGAVRRGKFALQDSVAQLEIEISRVKQERLEWQSARTQELEAAKSELESATVLLQSAQVRSPVTGRIDAIYLSPGDTVGPGTPVVRVVTSDVPASVTVYVPEKSRAFIRDGAVALLEFDQLPVGEFGRVEARVERVATELATRAELEATLGESAPLGRFVRVELSLANGREHGDVLSMVGSGAMVQARLPLRERRILALLFDPIREWLE